MIVVSDATPLNILVRIGHVDVIHQLFGRVLIPPAVRDELTHASTPVGVRDWISSAPPWLEIRAPAAAIDPVGTRDRGEREAIQLAAELKADLILMDDRRPRRIAVSLGLAVIGTIGILERASQEGLVDLPDAIQKLLSTDFYIDDELINAILRRNVNQ